MYEPDLKGGTQTYLGKNDFFVAHRGPDLSDSIKFLSGLMYVCLFFIFSTDGKIVTKIPFLSSFYHFEQHIFMQNRKKHEKNVFLLNNLQ